MNLEEMIFTVKGPKVRVSDIDRVEAATGFTFPDDYRKFLLTHNGGYSNEYCSEEHFVWIREWLSVCDKGFERPPEIWSLADFHENLKGEIPEGFLTIGVDVTSKHIVMKMTGEDRYWIGRWNWENDDPVKRKFESFAELIAKLSESKDPI